jgi:plastocyanin
LSWPYWSLITLAVALPLAGIPVAGGAEQEGGTIRGTVTVDDVPDPVVVAVDADQAVCGTEVEDRSTLVDRSGGVAYAVIVVKDAAWQTDPPMPEVSNRDCYFEPRVQVAKTGTVVTVKSEDESLHTTHAYDDRARTMFNIAIPIPGMEIQRPVRRPGVVRLECDSHRWMRGWLYVTDDIAGVTGLDGRFEISNVPPGTYELEIWHERYGGTSQTVTVTAGGQEEVDFTLR